MDKSGNVGPIGAILLFLVFIINWFVWLGTFVANIGAAVVVEHNLGGVEAFMFNNLNFVIMICMILGMMGFMYFTSGQ